MALDLNFSHLPKHIAIVMDGNGRWARERGHRRFFGHIRGAKKIQPLVECCHQLGIQAVTFFAFSTENWKRSEEEKTLLWRLLVKYLRKTLSKLKEKNIRLRILGNTQLLPCFVQEEIQKALSACASHTGMVLSFALSYGGRQEIAQAALRWAQSVVREEGTEGVFSKTTLEVEKALNGFLETAFLKDCSDVDLWIRTSGEQRLSNFLLWQSAYAELIFLDVFWPDFSPQHMLQALKRYQTRERRFGAVR